MSFLEEPAYKPLCCGQTSRWIVQTPTLHYFYCDVCKDEVDPVKGGKQLVNEPTDAVRKLYPSQQNALCGNLGSITWKSPRWRL